MGNAEVVVEAEIFPQILNLLKDMDVYVRKHAATCIREVAKHTPELAQLIVNAGGVGAMMGIVGLQGLQRLIGEVLSYKGRNVLHYASERGGAFANDAFTYSSCSRCKFLGNACGGKGGAGGHWPRPPRGGTRCAPWYPPGGRHTAPRVSARDERRDERAAVAWGAAVGGRRRPRAAVTGGATGVAVAQSRG